MLADFAMPGMTGAELAGVVISSGVLERQPDIILRHGGAGGARARDPGELGLLQLPLGTQLLSFAEAQHISHTPMVATIGSECRSCPRLL